MKLLEEEEYEENALVEFCRNDADEEDIMIDDDDASKKSKEEAGGAQDSIDDNDDNDDNDDSSSIAQDVNKNNDWCELCGIRRVSKETLRLFRKSCAFNVVYDLYNRAPDAKMVVLEGTSANLPGATAAENMSALRACIQAAICDLEMKCPDKIVLAVMKLEVLAESSKRPDRVDAHGVLVIHGTSECQFANDFQTCLITRGGMSKAMHHRDSTRVNVTLGVDLPQKTFDWMSYMLKSWPLPDYLAERWSVLAFFLGTVGRELNCNCRPLSTDSLTDTITSSPPSSVPTVGIEARTEFGLELAVSMMEKISLCPVSLRNSPESSHKHSRPERLRGVLGMIGERPGKDSQPWTPTKLPTPHVKDSLS